jgi:hypothetical protein
VAPWSPKDVQDSPLSQPVPLSQLRRLDVSFVVDHQLLDDRRLKPPRAARRPGAVRTVYAMRRLCFPKVRSPTRCDEAVSEVISADRRYQEALEIGGTAAALDGLARFAVIRGDHAAARELADEASRLHATVSWPAPSCERLGRVR